METKTVTNQDATTLLFYFHLSDFPLADQALELQLVANDLRYVSLFFAFTPTQYRRFCKQTNKQIKTSIQIVSPFP